MKFYTNVFQRGNYIHIRGISDGGERFQDKVLYEPYLFVSDKNGPYSDIHGNKVRKMNFDTIRDARDFQKQFKDVGNMTVYGYNRWTYMYIYDHFKREVPDTTKIKTTYIDIEVNSDNGFPEPDVANEPVTAIALVVDDQKYAFAYGDYETDDPNTRYAKCKNEYELLSNFLKFWEYLDPDVVSGWNSEGFDIPYLINRITKIISWDDARRLSPWKQLREYTFYHGTKEVKSYEMRGISHLDYLAVYKKFCVSPRESYRLDYIAELELGRKKIDYSEYGNLHTLHKENHQKFIEYNIMDARLVQELESELGYLDVLYALTYDSGCNYNDGLTTLTIWDTIIHNNLLDKNVVIPSKPNTPDVNSRIAGGYVKDPQVGMHDWVMSFDLNSLYPHLIMQYNISPDTWMTQLPTETYETVTSVSVDNLLHRQTNLDILKKYDCCVTPNGQLFSNEKTGFLPKLMQDMYDDRTKFKKKMIEYKKDYEKNPNPITKREITRHHNMQYALKILLNSAYGALANKYFRWFEQLNAEAITLGGQLSIRWIENAINNYMSTILKEKNDYVVAVDTDSVYINFGPLVEKVFPEDTPREKIINFLDKIASEKFEPFIDESYEELREYTNAYKQMMVMKRENIGDKAIWTAKKRYIMNVFDSEGVRYKEPKLKMMGIEAIRSSTPTACREYIKETLKLIMSTDEKTVQGYVAKIRKDFKKLPFGKIAFPRGLNIKDYADRKNVYKKGTPIQVKAALRYNKLLVDEGLDKQLDLLQDGEKIKFAYLKYPNPVKDSVIAGPDNLPQELKFDQYIDYDKQFVKGYLDPITVILDVIGWEPEHVQTLEDFFG